MALNNFSTDLLAVNVNGRVIDDWGNTDPPYSEDDIDQKSTLRRGMGGNATRQDRINPGKRVTLNLNPGGADSAFIKGLMNSQANVTLGRTQIGAGEEVIGSEGVIITKGTTGRGGATITDDQYIIEFNIWTEV